MFDAGQLSAVSCGLLQWSVLVHGASQSPWKEQAWKHKKHSCISIYICCFLMPTHLWPWDEGQSGTIPVFEPERIHCYLISMQVQLALCMRLIKATLYATPLERRVLQWPLGLRKTELSTNRGYTYSPAMLWSGGVNDSCKPVDRWEAILGVSSFKSTLPSNFWPFPKGLMNLFDSLTIASLRVDEETKITSVDVLVHPPIRGHTETFLDDGNVDEACVIRDQFIGRYERDFLSLVNYLIM